MGKRKENRVLISISVRVSGIDRDGNPFTQTARTLEVSPTGARISGVRCLRNTGEMVTVECGGRSARFVIMWIGIPGSREDGEFGIRCLQPEKRLFGVDFGTSRIDRYIPPAAPEQVPFISIPSSHSEQWDHRERRASTRIPCSGIGHIIQAGVAHPIWTQISEISLGGCYLEMIFAIPTNTAVQVNLTVGDRTIHAKGIVVTSHPGVGVGVKFTSIQEPDQAILTELIQELTARTRSERSRKLGESGLNVGR